MKSLVVLPGSAPRWAVHCSRHLAERLVQHGRVKVAFTHGTENERSLPGQAPAASVLGHAVSGYPVWTGRLTTALGLRRRRDVSIIMFWPGASQTLAVLASLAARIRREYVVVDVLDPIAQPPRTQPLGFRALHRIAHVVVHNRSTLSDDGGKRRALVLCGSNVALAELVVAASASMADETANGWCIDVHLDAPPSAAVVDGTSRRARHPVTLVQGPPPTAALREADVIVAEAGAADEKVVRAAVLRGAGGVLVGSPLALRVARTQAGVWLARHDAASLIVALESCSGKPGEPRVTVTDLERWTDRVLEAARCLKEINEPAPAGAGAAE